jgi:3-deoxy-D-manno-octulosonic-acid transferase
MRLIYDFFVQLYSLSIAFYAAFNDKANLWMLGRKHWKKKLLDLKLHEHDIFWIHCASLGEFEQGRPFIEEIKMKSNFKILLTFFSPSGYELRKNYQHADWVLYLPADTMANAQFFVKQVQPKAAFFIKYEFWFNYLNELKQRKVPVYLLSGIFRENQHFFKWYGHWARKQLQAFNCFFVQNKNSLTLLESIGYKNIIIAGDTRFDRVLQVMQKSKRFESIDAFVKGQLVVVAGSTYVDDEKLLKSSFDNLLRDGFKYKLILAPHVVSANRLNEIETIFGIKNCIRYSQLNFDAMNRPVLIIDNIGMLSSLYSYANIAYVGGGLGKGIHNTLEAAVFSIPLLFGNKYQKFDEAKALVQLGAAIVVENEINLSKQLKQMLGDEQLRKQIGAKSYQYVIEQKGALQKIILELERQKILH